MSAWIEVFIARCVHPEMREEVRSLLVKCCPDEPMRAIVARKMAELPDVIEVRDLLYLLHTLRVAVALLTYQPPMVSHGADSFVEGAFALFPNIYAANAQSDAYRMLLIADKFYAALLATEQPTKKRK